VLLVRSTTTVVSRVRKQLLWWCYAGKHVAEYRQHIEKDTAFGRRFQQVCGEANAWISMEAVVGPQGHAGTCEASNRR
jgi:hypothetical protein